MNRENLTEPEHVALLASGTHRCQPSCPHFTFDKCWHCQRVDVDRIGGHLLCADCLRFGEMVAAMTPPVEPSEPARGDDGDALYEQAGQYRTGPERWREVPEAVQHELVTVEQADEYMQSVDPERPWLMLTSDGQAWIQCADCDTWIQARPDMTHDEATELAIDHRTNSYPHVTDSPQRPSRNRAQRRFTDRLRRHKNGHGR